jgi:hypothetical protein
MHEIKWFKGRYEIITGLPLGEGSSFRVRERDSSSCSINLRLVRSRSGGLEWCSPYSPHLLCSLQWRWSRWGFSGGIFDLHLLVPLSFVDWPQLLGLVAPIGYFVLFPMFPHCCNEAIHLGLGRGCLFFLMLGPWLPTPYSFLILHEALLFICLEFECHVPSPYAESDLPGSDINPCIDIS